MRCSQPSIQSVPPLLGMRSEAGGDPGLRTSPKQRTTQKLRPVLPGHPGMLAMPWPKPEPGWGLAALM